MPTNVIVPALGESVSEATLIRWIKNDGDPVAKDEPVAELETDKANVDLPAPAAGVLRHAKAAGTTVHIGDAVATIEEGGAGKASAPAAGVGTAKTQAATAAPAAPAVPAKQTAPAKQAASESSGPGAAVAERPTVKLEDYSPAVRRLIEENDLNPSDVRATGPNGRLTKEDVERHLSAARTGPGGQPLPRTLPPSVPGIGDPGGAASPGSSPVPTPAPTSQAGVPATVGAAPAAPTQPAPSTNGERRVPMSKIRKRIAERLVAAQHTAAILTTFNEVDLQAVQELRGRYKDRFNELHGISLGIMSFFARAVVLALKEFPKVNGSIEGDDVVYHDYVHLGIAVSTERGLTVPVMRNVEQMSFAKVESEIKRLATAARDGKLGLQELTGSTFTITNGGVFGSLLSTPILNPPESAILGMHTIQKRPVVVNDKVEVRPMMYLALSYDHRLIDGRESVSFLVRVKQLLEDPSRMMLEV